MTNKTIEEETPQLVLKEVVRLGPSWLGVNLATVASSLKDTLKIGTIEVHLLT